MSKRITISLRDHVFLNYLSSYNGNISAYIEEMFLLGVDAATDGRDMRKSALIELNQENKKLRDSLSKAELENSSLREKIKRMKDGTDEMTPEEIEVDRLAQSIRLAGLDSWVGRDVKRE